MNNQKNKNITRRFVRVPISLVQFINMMTQGESFGFQCIYGLPPGARFVMDYFDTRELTAYLIYAHPSFDPIELGAEIPRLVPQFKTMELAPDPVEKSVKIVEKSARPVEK